MVDYLALYARLQPSAQAAADLTSGQQWTYRSFDRMVSQYASLLRSRGVGKGDRVAVLAKNRAELISLHLACGRIGAIFVPLNWRLSAPEIDTLIEDAAPHILLGDAMLVRTRVNGLSIDDFASAAQGEAPLPYEVLDQDCPSLILYTSGTSGHPKGVLLSERNIWQTALNFSLLGRVTHESIVLCDSPMFHIIGLITNVRPALMRGGRFIVSDGFVPARTLARLADPGLGVTHYFCVPQMAAMLRADPAFEPEALRRLTAIFSGGAPHAADAIRAWTEVGIPIADGFGMSEAGTVSCMPLDIDLIDSHAGSAGLVPPGVELRIIDDQGKDCAAGEAGEIVVRGAGVSGGYWRRPEQTRSSFTAEGWFKTGDVGRMDAEGFLWLIDRKKDMFISGGENVYPAEIERALAGYPDIAECAVVGVSDERWGEAGHLVIVPVPGRDIVIAEVLGYLESRLARYKIPRHVRVSDKLPRNGAGKVMKKELRAMLDAANAPSGGLN
ncbi:MAG TPA: AMP-binding protein [Steroidobacteraceae bacterium]|nr:AMP-binding protein [Steroidobacteraceae bacterium]